MKKLLVVITLLSFAGLVFASPPTPPPPAKGLKTYTVATLPAAASNTNLAVIVTDSDGVGDCTTGGQSDKTICVSDGTNWVATGDGTGGAGSGSLTTLQEGDAGVGGADIVTLDFGAGFDLTEDPNTEVNVALDTTEIGTSTWGSGSAVTWTFDASAGTDSTIAFGDGLVTFGHDIKITGDDLFMSTNTDGMALVADGTNFNPVQISGDVELDNTGATTIQANAVEESMLKFVDSAVDEAIMTSESTTGDFEWHTFDEIVVNMSEGLLPDDSIVEADLKAVDAAADENIFTYESTTGDFEWHTAAEVVANITEGSLANDSIVEADFKAVDAAADENIFTYESTTGDFEWHTFDEMAATMSAGALTDASVQENDLAAALAFDDGDQIDLSGVTYVNAATTNEGIAIPTYVAGAAPADNKPYLAYDASNNRIMVYESGGWADTSSGTGAANDLNYVVTQAEGGLSAESVLTEGYGIDVTDAGGDGGAVTIAVDTTEISADGTDTWSDNSNASIVWTFDVSGTDHTMTAGNGTMGFGDNVTIADGLTVTGDVVQRVDAAAYLTISTTDGGGTSLIQTSDGTDAITLGDDADNIIISGGNWDVDASGNVDITGTLQAGSGNHTLTSAAGLIDGEKVQDDTIDDDSIDFTDVTLADFDIDDFTGDTGNDDDLDVAAGGTGVSTLTDGGVLLGSGTGDVTVMAVLADGEIIVGDGTTDPVAESGATARASLGLTIGTNVQAYDADLADLADGELSASKVQQHAGTDITANLEEETHASEHIDGGDDAIDGDKIEISHTWDNITPDTGIAAADSVDDLAAILEGIDDALGGAAGATALDDIGNPDANGSIAMAGFTHTLTTATDGWGGMILDNTTADNASNTTLMTLQFADANDANSIFLNMFEDSDGTPVSLFKFHTRTMELGTNATISGIGDVSLDSIDNYQVGGSSLNDIDVSFTVDQTMTGITESGGTGVTIEHDAAAFLTINTADAGATTISQTSDGTDQIIIGDGSDRVDIASDSWDVTNGAVSGVTTLAMSGAFSPEGAINLGTGGVIFTDDGDGALTITGAGDGTDEDLTLNFDDTANTVVLSSSTGVTTIDFGAIAISNTTIDSPTMTGTVDMGGASATEIENSTSNLVVANAGEIAMEVNDDQLVMHMGAAGEAQGEVAISALEHFSLSFDPAYMYDQESTYRVVPIMYVGDDFPEGFTMTEWKVAYVGGDPATELDADIMCDTTPDFNPAAGATVMDVIDTTAGASTADTGFDSGTCANGSQMYIRFGADPTDANVFVAIDIWGLVEAD